MAEQFAIAPDVPVIDQEVLEGIVEIFGGDDQTAILDLIDTFLVESVKQCEEMNGALAASDWTLLHRMAHSLKSSSATFGAMRLSQVSARLEQLAKSGCVDDDCAGVMATLLAEYDAACDLLRKERDRFANASSN